MTGIVPERLVRLLRESPGLAPGLVAVGVFAVWAARDGGYGPLQWLPGTLFLLGVLVVYVVAVPGRVGGGWPIRLAVGALAAYTAWSYLSISWAGVQGDAWTGANRTLLYLCVFTLYALRPWRAQAGAILLGAFSLSITAIALWEFLDTVRSADPLDSFIAGRLAVPIAYANASCALFLLAAFPALFLSSRRQVHPLLRGAFLASAGALAELALVCQSRASLVAVPATLLVYFAIVPGRVRAALALAPVAVAVGLAAPRLLDVYAAVVSGQGIDAALVDARSALVWTVAALAVVGAAVGLADRAVEVPERAAALAGAALLAVVLVGAVGSGAIIVDRYGDPIARTSDWWAGFKSGRHVYEADVPHLVSGFGSGRYEIWRVAVEEFERHPVVGIGADNYAVAFLRERATGLEDPIYPHSLQLRVALQTGVVGVALFLLFLAGAGAAALRALVRGSVVSRAVAGAAATVFVLWLVYGSVDWFWEVPALGAPAFAFLGVAARTGDPLPPTGSGRARLALVAAVVSLAVVGACSLGFPWLAARHVDAAAAVWRSDPEQAFDRLDRARSLNPLSDEADVISAVIASQLDDDARQRAAFLRARERNPLNWYPLLQLGAIDGRAGRRDLALRWLEQAQRLNPQEPTITLVRERVSQGKPVSDRELERILLESVEMLTGERQD